MKFKKGQKVVCVDVTPRNFPDSGGLILNEIYTIFGPNVFGAKGVILYEVRSPYNLDGSFWEDRFEPLMDITELTEILEQQPEHA